MFSCTLSFTYTTYYHLTSILNYSYICTSNLTGHFHGSPLQMINIYVASLHYQKQTAVWQHHLASVYPENSNLIFQGLIFVLCSCSTGLAVNMILQKQHGVCYGESLGLDSSLSFLGFVLQLWREKLHGKNQDEKAVHNKRAARQCKEWYFQRQQKMSSLKNCIIQYVSIFHFQHSTHS